MTEMREKDCFAPLAMTGKRKKIAFQIFIGSELKFIKVPIRKKSI